MGFFSGSSGTAKGALLAQGIEETESQSSSASTSASHLPSNIRPATKEETKLVRRRESSYLTVALQQKQRI